MSSLSKKSLSLICGFCLVLSSWASAHPTERDHFTNVGVGSIFTVVSPINIAPGTSEYLLGELIHHNRCLTCSLVRVDAPQGEREISAFDSVLEPTTQLTVRGSIHGEALILRSELGNWFHLKCFGVRTERNQQVVTSINIGAMRYLIQGYLRLQFAPPMPL